jgi:hypothetical protein
VFTAQYALSPHMLNRQFRFERITVQCPLNNISFSVNALCVRPSESLYVCRIAMPLNNTGCSLVHIGPNSLCNGDTVCFLRHKPEVYLVKQHAIKAYTGLKAGIFVFLTWHLLRVSSFRLRLLYPGRENSCYVLSTMVRV